MSQASHSYGKDSIYRLGGPISWVEQSLRVSPCHGKLLARLMEFQIWYLPASSVALWGDGPKKEQWPLPTFLSGRKLSPSSSLEARHFSSSLYATGAF